MTRAHNPKRKIANSVNCGSIGSAFNNSPSDLWGVLVDAGILIYDKDGKYRVDSGNVFGTFSINPDFNKLNG